MNENVEIRDKSLMMVADRVSAFREEYPNWSIITEIVRMAEDWAVVKVTIFDPEGRAVSTGHANKPIYSLEEAETLAVGRSLGFLGIGIEKNICSYEEALDQESFEKRLSVEAIEKLIYLSKQERGDSREQAIDRIEMIAGKKVIRLTEGDYAKVAMEIRNG